MSRHEKSGEALTSTGSRNLPQADLLCNYEVKKLRAFLDQTQLTLDELDYSFKQREQFVKGLSPLFIQNYSSIKITNLSHEETSTQLEILRLNNNFPHALIHNICQKIERRAAVAPDTLNVQLLRFPCLLIEPGEYPPTPSNLKSEIHWVQLAVVSPDNDSKRPRVLLMDDDREKLRKCGHYLREFSLLFGEEKLQREYAEQRLPMVSRATDNCLAEHFPYISLVREVELSPELMPSFSQSSYLTGGLQLNSELFPLLLNNWDGKSAFLLSVGDCPLPFPCKILLIPPTTRQYEINNWKVIPHYPYETSDTSYQSIGREEDDDFLMPLSENHTPSEKPIGHEYYINLLLQTFMKKGLLEEGAFFHWKNLHEEEKIGHLMVHPSTESQQFLTEWLDAESEGILPFDIEELAELVQERIVKLIN